jgi:hypothetical protein
MHLALIFGPNRKERPGGGRASEHNRFQQRTGRFLQPVKMQWASQTIQKIVYSVGERRIRVASYGERAISLKNYATVKIRQPC